MGDWLLAPPPPRTPFPRPCTCGCRLPVRPTTARPRHDMATTPPGVCIRIPRRMRPRHPAASRLRQNTEDPARPPPPRPPHTAVNISLFAHTWPLPLALWPTPSRPASLPTARTTVEGMPRVVCQLAPWLASTEAHVPEQHAAVMRLLLTVRREVRRLGLKLLLIMHDSISNCHWSNCHAEKYTLYCARKRTHH